MGPPITFFLKDKRPILPVVGVGRPGEFTHWTSPEKTDLAMQNF
ncbi:hypothetical protein [Leptospira weilii]